MFEKASHSNRIFIFDPCFGSMTGHWENYCKRLYNELKGRGYTVKVFGQAVFDKKIIEGITFAPLFTHSPYVNMKNNVEFNRQVSLFLNNLKSIDETQFEDDDLFIFHSIFPQVFSAITAWTEALVAKRKVKVAIFFQFPPAAAKKQVSPLRRVYYHVNKIVAGEPKNHRKMDWVENETVRYYQRSTATLKPLIDNGSHILLASTDVLSRNFSALLDLPVHYLPMPGEKLSAQQLEQPVIKDQEKTFPTIKIGYFGHSSLEKGGQFLRYLVNKTLMLYPQAKFTLHVNPNPDTNEILKYFKTIDNPNIVCHHGHLEKEEMMKLMNTVDIILMPYSPQKYATTPSAMLTEGMPLCKIFVLPKHTWAYDEAVKYDAGYVAFDKYNHQNILKALIGAIIDFRTLRKKSLIAGKKFYQENNMTNYIDVVLKLLNTNLSLNNSFKSA